MKILKIAGLSLLCTFGASVAARASLVIDITQQGNNVVATATGSADTNGLNPQPTGNYASVMLSSSAFIGFGAPQVSSLAGYYYGISGPSSFGTGGYSPESSESGDNLFLANGGNYIGLPVGYVSGAQLFSTATWDAATLASLGLTDGTFTWTWGTGADADSLTINIGNPVAVPEPPSLALLGGGMLTLAGFAAMRRRKTAKAA